MKKLSIAFLAVYLTACSHLNVETVHCKITDKESVSTQEGHQYRVYSTCGTFVVEDQLTRLNFSSADVYGSLEVGKEYDIVAGGVRVPFLSMFKTIIEVK